MQQRLGMKLIHHAGKGRSELYDLGRDPDEQRDLSGDPEAGLDAAHELLAASWAQLQTADEAPELELDETTRERLRALGYLH